MGWSVITVDLSKPLGEFRNEREMKNSAKKERLLWENSGTKKKKAHGGWGGGVEGGEVRLLS